MDGCNTVTAERQNVKQSKKKTQQAELIKRQISQWGLKKPISTRNKVWDQTFKYDNCPKGRGGHVSNCRGETIHERTAPGGFESFGVVEEVCCDISVLNPGSP